MSVLVSKDTRLVVQGITGSEGTFHASQMLEYGKQFGVDYLVAGVTPGKGGMYYAGNEKDRFIREVPVYNTVREAVAAQKVNTSIIYVPAPFAADAIMEAAEAGIEVIVCITEGIPTADMMKAYWFVKEKRCHSHWSKLSRCHHARRSQGRHYAGLHFQERQHWGDFAQWHAHL